MVNQLLISQIRDLQYSERDSASGNFSPPLTPLHAHLKLSPISTPMSRTRTMSDSPHSSPCQDSKQQLSSSSPHLTSQAHCHRWTWHITEKIIFLACCFNYTALLLISKLLNLYILLNPKADCNFQGCSKHVSCYLSEFLIQYQEINSSLQCQTPSHTS